MKFGSIVAWQMEMCEACIGLPEQQLSREEITFFDILKW